MWNQIGAKIQKSLRWFDFNEQKLQLIKWSLVISLRIKKITEMDNGWQESEPKKKSKRRIRKCKGI